MAAGAQFLHLSGNRLRRVDLGRLGDLSDQLLFEPNILVGFTAKTPVSGHGLVGWWVNGLMG
jgi:hypothetical protein